MQQEIAEKLDDQLAAALPFAESEFAQEILVDAPEHILLGLQRQGRIIETTQPTKEYPRFFLVFQPSLS
jgi:hypothetical protein